MTVTSPPLRPAPVTPVLDAGPLGPRQLRAAAAFLICAVTVGLAAQPRDHLPGLALACLVAALGLAVHSSRRSLLVGSYAAVAVVAFVVAPLVDGYAPDSMTQTWWLVALWFAVWATAAYLARCLPPARARVRRAIPSYDVGVVATSVIGAVSLGVQAVLIGQAAIGYSAQVRGFASTGPLALLGAVGPLAIGTSYVIARLSRPPVPWQRAVTLGLVLAQALATAATGFRGGAPFYILTIWLVRKRWEPGWRLHANRLVMAAIAVAAILALFVLGAQQREQIADLAGHTSAGTRTVPLSSLPELVANRLDYQTSIQPAIQRASSFRARAAVSFSSELGAFVPRALWPGKPTVDYGSQVAQVFFDSPAESHTSSTITWLGDLFVQHGLIAITVAAFLVGFGITRYLGRPATAAGPSVAVYFVVVQGLLAVESPLIISAATAVRTLLTFLVAYVVVSTLMRMIDRGGPSRSAEATVAEWA